MGCSSWYILYKSFKYCHSQQKLKSNQNQSQNGPWTEHFVIIRIFELFDISFLQQIYFLIYFFEFLIISRPKVLASRSIRYIFHQLFIDFYLNIPILKPTVRTYGNWRHGHAVGPDSDGIYFYSEFHGQFTGYFGVNKP